MEQKLNADIEVNEVNEIDENENDQKSEISDISETYTEILEQTNKLKKLEINTGHMIRLRSAGRSILMDYSIF